MRRVVVSSIGFAWERVFRAVARIGLGEGDGLLLFNSLPKVDMAIEAMEMIKKRVEEVYPGVSVGSYWLDPRQGFEVNVALIRRRVEEHAPCEAFFLAVGGFRWLALALSYAAFAAHTLSEMRKIYVKSLELQLEEDLHSKELLKQMFPTQEERTIRIPLLLKLADVDLEGLQIMELVGRGLKRAKQLEDELRMPKATMQRKLVQLVNKGLLAYEKRGRSYLYSLTPLARMLVNGGPQP
ncbi:MAG: CRISPR-associated CARF protein Csa3 [Candidatus Nezhaarchaeales archaeon]